MVKMNKGAAVHWCTIKMCFEKFNIASKIQNSCNIQKEESLSTVSRAVQLVRY